MLAADTVHLVNLRVQKAFERARPQLELTADAFNLFNTTRLGFLSSDARWPTSA